MQSDNLWSTHPSNTDVVFRQQPSTRLPNDDLNACTNVWVDSERQPRNDLERQTTRMSFWDRFIGEGQATVDVKQSIMTLASYSWLNAFLIAVPLAWAIQFIPDVSHQVTFGASLIALLPLVKLLHFAGDELALNCGKITGDFVMITVNNSVETVMSILLLLKCELKLLQSTITGFILLRLLLVSGTALITGGMRKGSQAPSTHQSRLNQTMLMTGAFAFLLPALFYNTFDPHLTLGNIDSSTSVNELLGRQILDISRVSSPLLLIAYACSCSYLHYTPGSEETVLAEKDPEACNEPCDMTNDEEKPEVNFWVSLITIFMIGVLMMITAECLVSSIQPMKTKVREEWFGLVLIPLVSFAADGVLVTVYFIRSLFHRWLGAPYKPAGSLAETRAIDLSVQFMLLWTPVLILIGWILGQPISLLFDLFEVVLLIATCILLNYVAFDSKTSWAEGVMLVIFYFMVVITAWFYPGRQDIHDILKCNTPSSMTVYI